MSFAASASASGVAGSSARSHLLQRAWLLTDRVALLGQVALLDPFLTSLKLDGRRSNLLSLGSGGDGARALGNGRWATSISQPNLKFHLRAMLLARQDQEDFKAESQHALHDALEGVTEVKLHVEDARELQSINYMKQVRVHEGFIWRGHGIHGLMGTTMNNNNSWEI